MPKYIYIMNPDNHICVNSNIINSNKVKPTNIKQKYSINYSVPRILKRWFSTLPENSFWCGDIQSEWQAEERMRTSNAWQTESWDELLTDDQTTTSKTGMFQMVCKYHIHK